MLRYDIPYGPRMRANMAIANFVRRAMRKEPITVYADGKQGRCRVFISDLARGNCLALKETANGEIINLASKEFVTIPEMVDVLKRMFSSFPVKRESPGPNDFKGVQISIEKGYLYRNVFRRHSSS